MARRPGSLLTVSAAACAACRGPLVCARRPSGSRDPSASRRRRSGGLSGRTLLAGTPSGITKRVALRRFGLGLGRLHRRRRRGVFAGIEDHLVGPARAAAGRGRGRRAAASTEVAFLATLSAAATLAIHDADRDAVEAEVLAKLIRDEALIREVHRVRRAGEDDEHRRRRLGLRDVVEARRAPAHGGRRPRLEHALEEAIERAGPDALVERLADLVDGLEELSRRLSARLRAGSPTDGARNGANEIFSLAASSIAFFGVGRAREGRSCWSRDDQRRARGRPAARAQDLRVLLGDALLLPGVAQAGRRCSSAPWRVTAEPERCRELDLVGGLRDLTFATGGPRCRRRCNAGPRARRGRSIDVTRRPLGGRRRADHPILAEDAVHEARFAGVWLARRSRCAARRTLPSVSDDSFVLGHRGDGNRRLEQLRHAAAVQAFHGSTLSTPSR